MVQGGREGFKEEGMAVEAHGEEGAQGILSYVELLEVGIPGLSFLGVSFCFEREREKEYSH